MYVDKAVPSTVIASASKVPSTSTLPLMSREVAASSPVIVKLPAVSSVCLVAKDPEV